MPKVSIDGVEYDSETMSAEAKGNLDMLVMTEGRIRQLQAETAMLQTARQAYANALKQLLASPVVGETIKLD